MRTTKRIEWSYPTSTNADQLKFRNGCFSVELVDYSPHMQPGRAIAGFERLEDAAAFVNLGTLTHGKNPQTHFTPGPSIRGLFIFWLDGWPVL